MSHDVLCFSHLRWDFVYQRPNHLMARAARDRRVVFVEEPVFAERASPTTRMARRDGVIVVTPELPLGSPPDDQVVALRTTLDQVLDELQVVAPTCWYYTPMALPWSRHLDPSLVVYDSMDYLAGFRDAPAELLALEAELIGRADLVFCGGRSLYERMSHRHPDAHCFPSSVDEQHFRRGRSSADPADQAPIAQPRIGYAGVIDERLDLDLIRRVAQARPAWQIVLVGPVVKIDPADVPTAPNIHLLGMKAYDTLPAYLGGWTVGWMPFARNEATRYISPTKAPEYLAAGLAVVSTSIQDVVEPYGTSGLASIADTAEGTIAAVERILAGERPLTSAVDAFLSGRSWDRTWDAMDRIVTRARRPIASPVAGRRRQRAAIAPVASEVA